MTWPFSTPDATCLFNVCLFFRFFHFVFYLTKTWPFSASDATCLFNVCLLSRFFHFVFFLTKTWPFFAPDATCLFNVCLFFRFFHFVFYLTKTWPFSASDATCLFIMCVCFSGFSILHFIWPRHDHSSHRMPHVCLLCVFVFQVFPFCILFDQDMTILRTGCHMSTWLDTSDLIGSYIDARFTLRRPLCGFNWHNVSSKERENLSIVEF